jgi:predicted RNA methylase
MSLSFDFALTETEQESMRRIPSSAWFTQVDFRNVCSPHHPESDLDENHRLKRQLILPWLNANVKGRAVLDLFCANGAFSFEAVLAGAKEVVGFEFDKDRVQCAQFLSNIFQSRTGLNAPAFIRGDVYDLSRTFQEPFDVVVCLGGLYHIADPPHVLDQIRDLTRERLIVQTSSILNGYGSWGKFVLRKDETTRGMTSLIGGRGAWHLTAECFENMLRHAGFKIVESLRPSIFKRHRFPWYCALAEPRISRSIG